METVKNSTNKKDKIIYWVATIWLSLGMVSTGAVQLFQIPAEVDRMKHLGFPIYLLTMIGVGKILGVLTILIPKFNLLKEWAYAGFFFTMAGAVYSHIALGDPYKEIFGPSLLLILTIVSWYFRPANRKWNTASL